ncbi:MAG: hypothetical protein KC933_21135 [Myxococcales bacterium]|nr:hypothetical protein [Myxococcales bacterium]MCB9650456.1 hypothetical protein [Deltaproteobacteria bacterium]
MHPLAKYVLFSSAAVGLAWAAVTVDVGGRTPYGHVLAMGGDTWVRGVQSAWNTAWADVGKRLNGITGGDDDEKEAKAPARNNRRPAPARPSPAAPAVQEGSGARQRVALLRDAQKKAAPEKKTAPAAKTKVDAPMTKSDRAALDRLVAGR